MAGQLGHLAEAFIQSPCALLLGALQSSGLFQKIRASSVSHEKEIAAEHRDWLIRTATVVGDQINHVLRRVTWCVHRLQLNVSDFEGIAIVKRMVTREGFCPLALPVRPTLCGEIEFDGWIGDREFPRSTDEIRVNMGFGHGRDFQALVFGDFLIAVDIPLGIDDDGFTGSLASDEVGVLRQGGVGDLLEKHDSEFVIWNRMRSLDSMACGR